jgi:diguanylate cyclase (GGDEF)-like protein
MEIVFMIGLFVLAAGFTTAGWVRSVRRLHESLRDREDLANSSQVIEEERQMLELIADGAPLEKVLNTLNFAIERLSPGALCSVMLLDEESRRYLSVASAPSLPRDYLRGLVHLEIGPAAGACGTAAYLNETVVVTDIATDPKFAAPREFILSHGLRSCWSQPVRDSRNRVLGTFAIYHSYEASPRHEELRMARVAAQLAGNAIERTRAQAALAEARKRLHLAERVARFGIWEADFHKASFAISRQLANLMELPEDRSFLTKQEFEAAIHPEDLQALSAALDPVNAREGTIRHEFRLLAGDEVRWVVSHWRFDMTSVPPERATGAMIDITHERRMLAESQRARAEAEAAAEAARQAERLEQDRTIILEMVAKDEPLREIAQSMACAIASHLAQSVCAIRIELPDAPPVSVFAGVTDRPAQVLSHLEITSVRQSARPEAVRYLSASPEWQEFLGGADNFPHRFYRAVPILRNSLLIGLILEFSEGGVTCQMDEYLLESWSQYATLAVERRGLYDQLSFRAQYDSLTNLLNRASLYDRAGAQILRAAPGSTSMAVLYLDLDRFKDINDRYGHAAGDKVLQDVSRRIQLGIRRTDYAARIGGDEFVVILPGVSDRGEARRIADLLSHAIEAPVLFEGRELFVGASFGISIAPDDGIDIDTLLSKADDGMYRSKLKNRPRASLSLYRNQPEPARRPEPVAAF